MATTAEQILNVCTHFTGIQHQSCRKAVPYARFRKPNGVFVPLPCFKDGLNGQGCNEVQWSTPEDATAKAAAIHTRLTQSVLVLAEGRCPRCNQKVLQRQVGHCIYGSCGHRLYQGQVNPALTEPTPPSTQHKART